MTPVLINPRRVTNGSQSQTLIPTDIARYEFVFNNRSACRLQSHWRTSVVKCFFLFSRALVFYLSRSIPTSYLHPPRTGLTSPVSHFPLASVFQTIILMDNYRRGHNSTGRHPAGGGERPARIKQKRRVVGRTEAEPTTNEWINLFRRCIPDPASLLLLRHEAMEQSRERVGGAVSGWVGRVGV